MTDETDETDETVDATSTRGERPGDSMHELFHGEANVGATDDEHQRGEDAKQAASDEADRLREQPGHHGRDHL